MIDSIIEIIIARWQPVKRIDQPVDDDNVMAATVMLLWLTDRDGVWRCVALLVRDETIIIIIMAWRSLIGIILMMTMVIIDSGSVLTVMTRCIDNDCWWRWWWQRDDDDSINSMMIAMPMRVAVIIRVMKVWYIIDIGCVMATVLMTVLLMMTLIDDVAPAWRINGNDVDGVTMTAMY